jgi:hypothetical protein
MILSCSCWTNIGARSFGSRAGREERESAAVASELPSTSEVKAGLRRGHVVCSSMRGDDRGECPVVNPSGRERQTKISCALATCYSHALHRRRVRHGTDPSFGSHPYVSNRPASHRTLKPTNGFRNCARFEHPYSIILECSTPHSHGRARHYTP